MLWVNNCLDDVPTPARSAATTRKDLKAALAVVGELVDDKYFTTDDKIMCAAGRVFAEYCDKFAKLVGQRLPIARAIATGIPLHDDGCPIKGYVGGDGEKCYTKEQIEEARAHYANKDPTGGRVFFKKEAEEYLNDLTDGQITSFRVVHGGEGSTIPLTGANDISVHPCMTLGFRTLYNTTVDLFRERDIWNALRTQRPRVFTMKIVKLSMERGGKDGWES